MSRCSIRGCAICDPPGDTGPTVATVVETEIEPVEVESAEADGIRYHRPTSVDPGDGVEVGPLDATAASPAYAHSFSDFPCGFPVPGAGPCRMAVGHAGRCSGGCRRDAVPTIPPLPPSEPSPDPNPVVARCGECGLDLRRVMHYVCMNPRCPCSLRSVG